MLKLKSVYGIQGQGNPTGQTPDRGKYLWFRTFWDRISVVIGSEMEEYVGFNRFIFILFIPVLAFVCSVLNLCLSSLRHVIDQF